MKKIFVPILILLLSIFSWGTLLSPGFFTIHDNQQIARLYELDKALSSGQFPVRWVPDLGFGFGYALFNFYPPLVYYLGEVFHLSLGIGFVDSIKLVWFVALVGSALAMYVLAKEFFGKIGGIVSAMFYLYAPYHAVDAYVRGALAELFSFVWLPLILFFSYKTVIETKFKYALYAGLFLALLMLTHNLNFLPFFGLFTLWYAFVALIYGRQKFVRIGVLFLVSCLFSFGLTVFFWLPSLVEKQYTLVDQLLVAGPASFKIHFVCLSQLWNSLWGYGGSAAGCVDGLSFKIGKPQIILSVLTVIISFLMYTKQKIKKTTFYFLSAVFCLLLVSAFMMLDFSNFIWSNIPQLWYLQFPWRFLEFTALFCALLVGGLFTLSSKKILLLPAAALAVFSVIFLHGKYFAPQTFTNSTESSETSPEQINWIVSSTSFEYLPKGIATKYLDSGALWLDISKSDIPKTNFQLISGSFDLSEQKFLPDRFTLTGESTAGATVRFNIANFPGWKIWIDGQDSQINDQNKYKLITVKIDPGSHKIIGQFTDTLVRRLGNVISVIFTLALILGLYGTRRNKT